jgi:hypothetical protein
MNLSLIKRVAEAVFRAFRPTLRTHIIGQVVSYDAAANTAVIQPVLKIIRGTDVNNMTTIDPAPLSDVPVRQYGSGKLWCTVGPAVGSYGELHIADRAIDGWLSAGGVGVEPTSTRTHDISDAVFEPSLTHLVDEGDNGAFAVGIATDRVSLRTRSGDTEISVLDDETIAISVNGGVASISIDTSGNVSVTADGDIALENANDSFTVGAASIDAGGGTDFVALAMATDNKIQAIADAITNAAVTPMDGGAAFKAAIIAAMTPALAAIGSVASSNLKAD